MKRADFFAQIADTARFHMTYNIFRKFLDTGLLYGVGRGLGLGTRLGVGVVLGAGVAVAVGGSKIIKPPLTR
jgi:hypothetical protein